MTAVKKEISFASGLENNSFVEAASSDVTKVIGAEGATGSKIIPIFKTEDDTF